MPVHCSTRDHKIKIRNALKNTCQDPAEGNGTEKQSHEESDLHDMSSSEEFGDWGSKSDIGSMCSDFVFDRTIIKIWMSNEVQQQVYNLMIIIVDIWSYMPSGFKLMRMTFFRDRRKRILLYVRKIL